MGGISYDDIPIGYSVGGMLRAVEDEFKRVESQNENLRKTILGWNKDKEIQEANQRAIDLRSHSLCILSDNELERLKKFRGEHYIQCSNSGEYIFDIAETGIGHCISVKCPVCGKEMDITDFDCW